MGESLAPAHDMDAPRRPVALEGGHSAFEGVKASRFGVPLRAGGAATHQPVPPVCLRADRSGEPGLEARDLSAQPRQLRRLTASGQRPLVVRRLPAHRADEAPDSSRLRAAQDAASESGPCRQRAERSLEAREPSSTPTSASTVASEDDNLSRVRTAVPAGPGTTYGGVGFRSPRMTSRSPRRFLLHPNDPPSKGSPVRSRNPHPHTDPGVIPPPIRRWSGSRSGGGVSSVGGAS